MYINGHCKIAGAGAYFPSQKVTSEELMDELIKLGLNRSRNFISKVVGIEERRVEEADVLPSYMAYLASVEAIEKAGIRPEDIDMIIYCGIDRDCHEPATATRVQKLLGAPQSTTSFDVSNACIGFLNGVRIANAEIATGGANNVLLCSAEKLSRLSFEMIEKFDHTENKDDFFNNWVGAMTLGDGAGAMIIQRSDGVTGFKSMSFKTRSELVDLCTIKEDNSGTEFSMSMAEINSAGIELHTNMFKKTLESTGWTTNNIDKIYSHQTGRRPHKAIAEVTGVPLSKIPETYKKLANLTSVTFPANITLNPPSTGERVLYLGAGSGLHICQLTSLT